MTALLAVDLGLRTGLALYGQDGRLQWYRSHNFGTTSRLRRAVRGLLDELPELTWLVLEGGGHLADIWKREAGRRALRVHQISAEEWRQLLLLPRQQRRGSQAKASAETLAKQIIAWSHARRPTSLRDDAAEAILIGLWGALAVGWLTEVPDAIHVYGLRSFDEI
jgi:hypothetical protein